MRGVVARRGADVTRGAPVAGAFARIVGEAGRLDVLVNCAGGFTKLTSVEDTPEEEWDRIVALNLKTAFLCAKAAIPTFKRQRSGRIVNIGSIAGVSPWPTTQPAYAAVKAGVHNLTRSLAVELGPHGVCVNAIAPGTTASERSAISWPLRPNLSKSKSMDSTSLMAIGSRRIAPGNPA